MKKTLGYLLAFLLFFLCVPSIPTVTAAELLNNPGFDLGQSGWSLKAGSSIESNIGRSGSGGALLKTTTSTHIQQNDIPVEEGCLYRLRFWYNAKSLTDKTTMGYKLEFYGESGYLSKKEEYIDGTKDMTAWHQYMTSFTVPADCVKINLLLRLHKEGEIYIDDASLVKDANTLLNGDFENGLAGWIQGKPILCDGIGENNTHIAKLVRTAETTDLQQNSIKVDAGAEYTLGFWCYIASPADKDCVSYKIEYGGGGQQTAVLDGTDGIDNWKYYTVGLTAPQSCTYINLLLRLRAEATVYFDDVTLLKKESPQIINSDFENGTNGWYGSFSIAEDMGRDGSEAALIETASSTYLAQQKIALQPKTDYRLSFWAYPYSLNSPAAFAYKFEYYGASGHLAMDDYGQLDAELYLNKWHQYTADITTPEKTEKCNLLLRLYQAGKVLIDDVQLIKLSEPKSMAITEADILTYTENGGGNATVKRYETDTYKPGDGARAVYAVYDGDTPVTESKTVAFSEDTASFDFSNQTLTEGKAYTLRVTLCDRMYRFTQTIDVYKYKRPALLDAGGHVRFDGEVFYPVMAYHVYIDQLRQMPAIGVNTVQCPYTSASGAKAYLDKADVYGIKVMVPLYQSMLCGGDPRNEANTIAIVEAVKTHNALLGYLVMDEPFAYIHDTSMLVNAYNLIRQQGDEKHIVSFVNDKANRDRQASKYVDVLLIDPYVWSNTDGVTSFVAEKTENAVNTGKPVWVILQASRLQGFLPDAADVRSMACQALAAGAKGFGYYSIYDCDGTKSMMLCTDLWNGLCDFKNEHETLFSLFDGIEKTKYYDVAEANKRVIKWEGITENIAVFNLLRTAQTVEIESVNPTYTDIFGAQDFTSVADGITVEMGGSGVRLFSAVNGFTIVRDNSVLKTLTPGQATVYANTPCRLMAAYYRVTPAGNKELLRVMLTDGNVSQWEISIEDIGADVLQVFAWQEELKPVYKNIVLTKTE